MFYICLAELECRNAAYSKCFESGVMRRRTAQARRCPPMSLSAELERLSAQQAGLRVMLQAKNMVYSRALLRMQLDTVSQILRKPMWLIQKRWRERSSAACNSGSSRAKTAMPSPIRIRSIVCRKTSHGCAVSTMPPRDRCISQRANAP
jgi:hypothetical protein